jgi:peptidoglycan/xylan/chitin deacetylase (PgdA/CDA1 family)
MSGARLQERFDMAHPRDLIGYAGKPPDPKWPGGARLALNIVLNYEEGSEAERDGDGFTETGLIEMPGPDVGGRDLGAESMFEYGSRIGFWRIMRILQERGLPMTIFGCALALERRPPPQSARPTSTCAATVGAGSSTTSSTR